MTDQNKPVNAFDLTRRLEIWLLEDEVRQRHGLPRPVKQIITSSHVSPVSAVSSSGGSPNQYSKRPRQSFHPAFDPGLLNRSLAYHRDQNARLSTITTQKRKSGLPVASKHSSFLPPPPSQPVPRPGKQNRVKVDSANGSLEKDDAETHTSNECSGSANLSSLRAGSASKRRTLSVGNRHSGGSEPPISPSFLGTGSLLSPSSTLYGSHASLGNRSPRNTSRTGLSEPLTSAGLESHLSLEYDSIASGLSSPNTINRDSTAPGLSSALGPSLAARRGTERIVGRMDLKTGKYVLSTVLDGHGSSSRSPRSPRSLTPGSNRSGNPMDRTSPQQSHRHSENVNDIGESKKPEEEKIIMVPGEERRANWAQTDDDESAAKEGFMRRLRRRTLGAMSSSAEQSHETQAAKPSVPLPKMTQQAQPTTTTGSMKPRFTDRSGGGKAQRPAPPTRSQTAPSNSILSETKEPTRKPSTRQKDSDNSPEAQGAWKTLLDTSCTDSKLDQSELNHNETKKTDSLRPQFQLFPATSSESVPTVGTARPRAASQPKASNRASRSHSLTRSNNFDTIDPFIVAQINEARSRSKQASPVTDTFPIKAGPTERAQPETSLLELSPPPPPVEVVKVIRPTTGGRPSQQRALQPVPVPEPPMWPLMSDAELAKMTAESRALFKRQEILLRNRLNNTAYNTAYNTALPTAVHTVVATTVGTAVHSVQHSVGSLTPMKGLSPPQKTPKKTLSTPRSQAIVLPAMPKLHSSKASDTPGRRPHLPAPLDLAQASRGALMRSVPVESPTEPMRPQRSPTVPGARQSPTSILHSTPFHEPTRRQVKNKPPPTTNPPPAAPAKDTHNVHRRPARVAGTHKTKQERSPAPPPKDHFSSPLDTQEDDLDTSQLSADDGPGPTIEDPRYFDENVLKIKSNASNRQLKEKKSFWKKMTVRVR